MSPLPGQRQAEQPARLLPSFAVVIPMFNEEAGAEACVRRVCAELLKLPHRTRLIVVNDGSRDHTGEILSRLAASAPKLLPIAHAGNRGYGAALRTGAAIAHQEQLDYVLFMDSDLTNNPADIPRFLPFMEQGVDVIKASRFVEGGRMQGVPWRRSIFSYTGNLIASCLFHVGVRDCTNGFRAVKVTILARMNLRESGFPVIVEELYQAKTLARSFCEVPVVLTSRSGDQRPTVFSYKPETLRKYLAFAIRAFLGIKPDLKREILR